MANNTDNGGVGQGGVTAPWHEPIDAPVEPIKPPSTEDKKDKE